MDGALDEARAAEVEAALTTDAGLRRTVRAYRMQNHGLRLLYDAVLSEPVPERLKNLDTSSDKRRRH